MYVTCSVARAEATAREKRPSRSVTVPLPVPFSMTVAPMMGSPAASVTVPCTWWRAWVGAGRGAVFMVCTGSRPGVPAAWAAGCDGACAPATEQQTAADARMRFFFRFMSIA